MEGHDWTVLVLNPTGDPFEPDIVVLTDWSQVQVEFAFGSSTVQVTAPNVSGGGVEHIVDYKSDIVLLRQVHPYVPGLIGQGNINRAQMRTRVLGPVDKIDDTQTTVDIPSIDYAGLLKFRLFDQADLNSSYPPSGGGPDVPARLYRDVGAFDIATDLIHMTENKASGLLRWGELGVNNLTPLVGTTPPNINVLRDRTYDRVGMSIYEAIDNLAQVDNGFDWWTDVDDNPPYAPRIFAQNPRRNRDRTGVLTLVHGGQVASVDRTPTSGFANVAIVTGSQGVPAATATRLEGTPDPRGRWERVWDQANVIDPTTLVEYSSYYVGNAGRNLPTYRLSLTAPTWFDYDMQLGDVCDLRVIAPPRMNFVTRVRVVGATITITPDGAEDVVVEVVSDDDEVQIVGGRTAPDTGGRFANVNTLARLLAELTESKGRPAH